MEQYKINISVGDVMRRWVATADEDASILDIAQKMRKHKINSVLIAKDGVLKGIVTKTDILRAMDDRGCLKTLQAKDIMIKEVKNLSPDFNILDAISMMDQYGVNTLPIIHRGKIVGILGQEQIRQILPSLLDLMHKTEETDVPAASEEEEFTGYCASCGNYSTELKVVNGDLLCPACR